MTEEIPAAKKPMTTEERLSLSTKLDKELDEFIAGLEKRQYTEGWPEDRWEEEMEKHPFFMTKTPDGSEPLNPLLEGIQQLKYDETENSPRELAINYKEDGNFNFKCKKYRMAILSYTEGIRQKCGDPEIEAQLYNNRGASQFFLKNYRSCIRDCYEALKFDPKYTKAKLRAAQCCLELHKTAEAIKLCDEVLKEYPTHPHALEYRTKAVITQKVDERNERKSNIAAKKHTDMLEEILSAIRERNIRVEVKGDLLENLDLAREKPSLQDGSLVWPVFILYPQHKTSDFIEEFNENSTFLDHLVTMFQTPPDWDVNHEYKINELAIYYEGVNRDELYLVDLGKTLKETLSLKTYAVRDWKPTFYIVVKNSPTEKRFHEDYTVHLTRF